MDKIIVPNLAHRANFINKVFFFFAVALLLSSAGVWGGMQLLVLYPQVFLSPAVNLGLFLLLIGMSFTIHMWQDKVPLGYVMFALFTIISGLTLAPLIAYAGAIGGAPLVLKALLAATCTFAAAGLWGWITQKDLSSLGGILMVSLIGIIVVSLINFFLGSKLIDQLVSIVGIVVFTVFTAYDIQNIKDRYSDSMFLAGAIALYLDFVNLFTLILRFFISSRD